MMYNLLKQLFYILQVNQLHLMKDKQLEKGLFKLKPCKCGCRSLLKKIHDQQLPF